MYTHYSMTHAADVEREKHIPRSVDKIRLLKNIKRNEKLNDTRVPLPAVVQFKIFSFVP